MDADKCPECGRYLRLVGTTVCDAESAFEAAFGDTFMCPVRHCFEPEYVRRYWDAALGRE